MRPFVVPSLVLFLLAADRAAARPQHPAAELREGLTVEGSLHGGAVAEHVIAAVASQFVEARVDQHGIDVVVTLRAPDGTVVAEVDGESDASLPERVIAVLDAAGDYRLVVTTRWSDARPGHYAVTLEHARAATAGDTACSALARDTDEGRRLTRQQAPGSLSAALTKFESAAAGLPACADPRLEPSVLLALAEAQARQNARAAAETAERLLASARAIGDRVTEGRALSILAYELEILGQRERARENVNAALQLSRETGSRTLEGRCLNTLAIILDRSGALEESIDVYGEALTLSEAADDRRNTALVLNNMGNALRDLGDTSTGLDVERRAIAQARAAGDADLEATAESNHGNTFKKLGRNGEALEHYRASLALARQIGSRRAEGQALNNVGQIHRRMGDPRTALAYHEQSLSIRRAVGDRAGESAVLESMGRAWAALGDFDRAIAYYKDALEIRTDMHMRVLQSDTLLQMARAQRDHKDLAEARRTIESALEVIESIRADTKSAEYRTSYRAAVAEQYDFYVQLLMEIHEAEPTAGHDAEALHASETGRARVLLESLAEDQQVVGSDPTRRGAAKPPRPEALSLRQIQTEVLDDTTVLLEYALGEGRSTLWAITGGSMESHRLPARSALEDAAREVHGSLAARPGGGASIDLDRELRALGGMLVGPVAQHLRDEWKGKRLLVVADGALQYVPFSLLKVAELGGAALLERHEVVNAPSASVLATIRRDSASRRVASRAVAVLADPVFDRFDPRVKKASLPASAGARAMASLRSAADGPAEAVPSEDASSARLDRMLRSAAGARAPTTLSRLPFSREEAQAILSLAPRDASLEATGFRATRELATGGELPAYRIVHFATHGLLNAESPDLSGLVLSLVDEVGRRRDGVVRLRDVQRMKLSADLVVLSGCQTALGKEISGEGLVGLTRGFLHAGARNVVASLWRVDDLATAELMKRFYGPMLRDGKPAAAALRQAQIEMSRTKRWSAPFYWAGFVIQGDWTAATPRLPAAVP